MNFGTIFDLPLTMWPDKEALIYGPHRITYRTLEERTNRVANGLAALGIGVGDHVAVLSRTITASSKPCSARSAPAPR